MANFNELFPWTFLIYIGVGLVWLLPRKIKLMKRLGYQSNAELYRLAKNGDREAILLKKQTTIFLVIGIIVLVPLRILS